MSSGYLELLRTNRNYRFLWFGELVSFMGDWFNLIASAALIAQLTDSGLAIGSLFVIRTLAPFLVSPIAGVVADRYNRKQILIISDLLRGVTVLGFLLVREPGQEWLLYTLTAIQLGLSGFFVPARLALIPTVVSGRELGTANALSSATWSVMLAVGAGLGGFVSGIFGIYTAFTIDALTFILSALFIMQIAYRPAPELNDEGKTLAAGLRQYFEGIHYLRNHPDVLVITLHKGMISMLSFTAFQVIQVRLAERVFIYGAGGGIGLGLLFSIAGVSSAIGPIIARRVTGDRDRSLRLAIIIGYMVASLGLFIAAPLFSFGSVLSGSFVRALGSGVVWVFSTQLLLQRVPNRVQGRVFASEFAFFTLSGAISSAIIGRAIDLVPISSLIYGLSGLILVPALLWGAWTALGKLSPVSETTQELERLTNQHRQSETN